MADGIVKILTELDNTGFTKGLGELKTSTASGAEQMKGTLMAVGVTITAIATAIGTAGFKFNSQMENYQAGFSALLGSAEKSTKMVKELQEMAAKTPFELTDLAEASQTLLAFGMTAEDIIPTLKNIGDVSLGNKERFKALSLAFAQVQAAGKLTGQDLLQMVNAGFNPLQEISKKTGKSLSELKDEMSDGAISAQDVADAFKSATAEGGRFNGAMEKQSKTLTGQFSTLKDNFSQLSGQIMKPLYDMIANNLLPVASDFISKLSFGIKTDDWKELNSILTILSTTITIATTSFLAFKAGAMIQTVVQSFQMAQVQLALYTATAEGATIAQGILNGTLSIGKGIVALLTGQISLTTLATTLWTKAQAGLNAMILANPIGALIALVAGLTAGIFLFINAATSMGKTVETNLIKGFDDFTNSVLNAKSRLEEFSGVFSAYDQKASEIQTQIAEVQKGITDITSMATAERRALTDSEIAKLDEYFQKLNTLEQQELKIIEAKRQAVATVTQSILDNLTLSADEYKNKGAEMLKTQEDINTQTLNQIDKARIDEVAALNQKFGDQANISNQAYADQLNKINSNYDQQKQAVADGFAKQWEQYVAGYAKLIGVDLDYNTKVKAAMVDRNGDQTVQNVSMEDEMTRHTNEMNYINTTYANDEKRRNSELEGENKVHNQNMGEIWRELIKGLDSTKQQQLTTLIGMVADASSKGAEVETKMGDMVTGAVSELDKMPPQMKTAMNNAMQPLIDAVDNKKPTILQRITSLGQDILRSLNKSFQNASPSKATRKIFQNVMKGMMVGIDREENNLFDKVDDVFSRLKSAMVFNGMGIESSVSTGNIYNRAYNTIPVSVNGTYTSNVLVDGEILATTVNRVDTRRNLQYGY